MPQRWWSVTISADGLTVTVSSGANGLALSLHHKQESQNAGVNHSYPTKEDAAAYVKTRVGRLVREGYVEQVNEDAQSDVGKEEESAPNGLQPPLNVNSPRQRTNCPLYRPS